MREVEVRLKSMDVNGQARGRFDGRIVFAWGGLPDEKVTARITKRKRRWMSGVVTEVHEPSPRRIEPREDHFMICSPWSVIASS